MRPNIIILGLIILIIGIFLFIYGNNHYSFYEQKSEINYIEIPNTNNADVDKEMAFGTTVKYFGIFILALSALILAIGFYKKD
jgi:hypothetical protein